MPTDLNYYQLLDLTPEASSDEVHYAYRLKSKVYHPDTTQLPPKIALQKFQLLNEAYGTLSSPALKKNYDHQLGLSTVKYSSQYNSHRYNLQPTSSFLEKQERPLSAGELLALLILSLTFLGCLVLALILGFTRGEMMLHEPSMAAVNAYPFDRHEIPNTPRAMSLKVSAHHRKNIV